MNLLHCVLVVLKNFYPKQAIMRGDLEGAKVSEY